MTAWNLTLLVLGTLLGWLTTPIVWATMGPFRTIARIGATAAQESGYNASAFNAERTGSLGMLQFQQDTWESLGGTADDRESPFWSGYYGVKYIGAGLLTSWKWWAIGIPIFGLAIMRFMWTSGISASSAERALSEAWERASSEGQTFKAYLWWRLPLLVPTAIAFYVAWVVSKKVRA